MSGGYVAAFSRRWASIPGFAWLITALWRMAGSMEVFYNAFFAIFRTCRSRRDTPASLVKLRVSPHSRRIGWPRHGSLGFYGIKGAGNRRPLFLEALFFHIIRRNRGAHNGHILAKPAATRRTPKTGLAPCAVTSIAASTCPEAPRRRDRRSFLGCRARRATRMDVAGGKITLRLLDPRSHGSSSVRAAVNDGTCFHAAPADVRREAQVTSPIVCSLNRLPTECIPLV